MFHLPSFGFALALVFSPFILLLCFLFFVCYPRPVRIPFRNRHVFITGGSSGIGLELAKLAASDGASVSLMARDPGRLADAKRCIADSTGKDDVRVFSADVKDFEAVKAVAEQAGPVDILICSHGIATPNTLEETSLAELNDTLDTNLRGTLHVIKAMLPSMKNRQDPHCASIAIFSSQAGQAGLYGYTVYSASKFGVRGIAEALQQEIHCNDIRVSVIYPPDTYTPGFDKENEKKPELSKILSGSSSAMKAVDVARKTINGIKAGQFCIACNFDGLMLSIATAGMSPQPSVTHAFVEVLFSGFMRLVGFCIMWNWYKTIVKWKKQEAKAK